MSTPQPEETEQDETPVRLLLVKPEPLHDAQPPQEQEAQEETTEEAEETEDEEEQSETAPSRRPHRRSTVGSLLRETVGPLELRSFVNRVYDSLAVGSVYIPRAIFEWICSPVDGTKESRRPVALRGALVVVPTVVLGKATFKPGGGPLLVVELLAWVTACWLLSDAAHKDARKRRKKKKAAAKAKKKKQREKEGKPKEKKEKKSKEAPPAPREPTPEEIVEETKKWIAGKIGTGNGIHLDMMLKIAKKEKRVPQGSTQSDLRKYLESHGIKVDDGVNVGRVNRQGVKKADLGLSDD